MKRRIKLTLIAAFSTIVFTASMHFGSKQANASGDLVTPRSLFVQNCARCHGSDGRANTPAGRKLEAADLTGPDVQARSVASISRTIRNGRPGMPAFGKRLSPAQIKSIAGYVRSL